MLYEENWSREIPAYARVCVSVFGTLAAEPIEMPFGILHTLEGSRK